MHALYLSRFRPTHPLPGVYFATVKTGITSSVHEAAQVLRNGGLCAIPTETVYGLAGNAFDPETVVGIFEVKARPTFDPLIVHIAGSERLPEVATEFSPLAQQLAEAFWPGPLTLILPRAESISDLVTSGLSTVGVRVPDHPLTRELLELLPFPLAAPSANPFGYISPTTAEHVLNQLGGKIPLILDGGPCTVGIESTIVDCSGERPRILRLGGISVEEIIAVVGKVAIETHSTSNPSAPGMLTTHYAPRKPLIIGDPSMINQHSNKRVALLAWNQLPGNLTGIVLSPTSNLSEAASNLFAALRELDHSDAEMIIAETVPDEGLGRAINDRLRRASAGSANHG